MALCPHSFFKEEVSGIRLHYQNPRAQGESLFGQDWMVNPTDKLLRCMWRLLGNENVRVIYGR